LTAGVTDEPLLERDLDPDPIRQFVRWFDEATAAGQPEPEAMALATSTTDGEPSVRFVLLRGIDARGFVFYTNGRSRKGRDITVNPRAALVFRWWRVERQVRVAGPVEPVDPSESEAYFRSRPRGAQLGAWASAQSETLEDRAALERRFEEAAGRFAGQDIPRPLWWGGFRVRPVQVEFWQSRPNRLHDRLAYRITDDGDRRGWTIERLNP
jgi:pyridoxamine 5'-phosphate oxidase